MIKPETAKKMYDYYTKRIDQLIQAQEALTGGVKSYTIGDRQMTYRDLDTLSDELEAAVEKQAYYDAILHGRATRKITAILPTDK
ncbi:MAG: hypothetical protein J1F04_01595 [Oscillospiraceae bacterium]|nr:hypothetical protein [Oscillospiraceae bacterium]